uniref:DIX domain-containing protein n=1 Tax=Steinernema glaseri TaxID=37863 RepID=A0A1I7ZFD2_9BILA
HRVRSVASDGRQPEDRHAQCYRSDNASLQPDYRDSVHFYFEAPVPDVEDHGVPGTVIEANI